MLTCMQALTVQEQFFTLNFTHTFLELQNSSSSWSFAGPWSRRINEGKAQVVWETDVSDPWRSQNVAHFLNLNQISMDGLSWTQMTWMSTINLAKRWVSVLHFVSERTWSGTFSTAARSLWTQRFDLTVCFVLIALRSSQIVAHLICCPATRRRMEGSLFKLALTNLLNLVSLTIASMPCSVWIIDCYWSQIDHPVIDQTHSGWKQLLRQTGTNLCVRSRCARALLVTCGRQIVPSGDDAL